MKRDGAKSRRARQRGEGMAGTGRKVDFKMEKYKSHFKLGFSPNLDNNLCEIYLLFVFQIQFVNWYLTQFDLETKKIIS